MGWNGLFAISPPSSPLSIHSIHLFPVSPKSHGRRRCCCPAAALLSTPSLRLQLGPGLLKSALKQSNPGVPATLPLLQHFFQPASFLPRLGQFRLELAHPSPMSLQCLLLSLLGQSLHLSLQGKAMFLQFTVLALQCTQRAVQRIALQRCLSN